MDGTDKHTNDKVLNVINEDVQEGKSECMDDSVPKCSKNVDQLSVGCQPEKNVSWSSASDTKKKHKKKGLLKNHKKVKDISNLSGSKSTEPEQVVSQEAKKTKKKTRKEKAQSSAFFGIFRGKSTDTEEKPKQKKPLQKSQSFNTTSAPKNSQLNRMDSFRKLFKRPHDPAALAEATPIDNLKCVEISSPILKSDIRSANLVDREVFLRERSYQVDKTKIKKVEAGIFRVNKNNDTTVNNGNHDSNEEKTEEMVCNGCLQPQDGAETQESSIPVPPVRHKHLQYKQRLSIQGDEGLLQEDLTKDNENNNKSCEQENNKNIDYSKSVQDSNNESTLNETKLNAQERHGDSVCSADEANDSQDKRLALNERRCKVINVEFDSQVTESAVNDELQQAELDNAENLNYVVVKRVPDDSSAPETPDTTPTQIGEHACTPQSPEGASHVTPNISPSQVRDPTPQSPESEFAEVFVDCINDERFSLDSATLLVDKPQIANDKTNGVSMPAGRWKSDVSSNASQHAIHKAINKTASLPGRKGTVDIQCILSQLETELGLSFDRNPAILSVNIKYF
jgi:hypothetical protein